MLTTLADEADSPSRTQRRAAEPAGDSAPSYADRSPCLISVAPNGARRTRRDHPALPLTPSELATDAQACATAGAALYHLHVRDGDGGHSLDAGRYRDALEAIAATVGDRMLVQITTEACGRYTVGEQMAVVRAVRPAAASFAVREFFAGGVDAAPARAFFAEIAVMDVAAQFICYSPGEAARLRRMIEDGALPYAAAAVLFVLGRFGDSRQVEPDALLPFRAAWRDTGPWSVCAFGPNEIGVAAAAVALGGHVRVGFENNLQRPDGTRLASNAEQIGQVAALAAIIGRPLADAVAARTLGGSCTREVQCT